MLQKEIKISGVEDAKAMADIAAKFDFKIELVCGDNIVNAKSVIDIFTLDLSKSLILRADKEDSALIEAISSYIIKK